MPYWAVAYPRTSNLEPRKSGTRIVCDGRGDVCSVQRSGWCHQHIMYVSQGQSGDWNSPSTRAAVTVKVYRLSVQQRGEP